MWMARIDLTRPWPSYSMLKQMEAANKAKKNKEPKAKLWYSILNLLFLLIFFNISNIDINTDIWSIAFFFIAKGFISFSSVSSDEDNNADHRANK